MDDQQRLLRDAAAAFCAGETSFRRVRALRATQPGFDRSLWRKMAELGWLGVVFPEEFGGAGLGFRDFAAVLSELGKALVPEPVAAAVLAGRAILHGDNEPLKHDLLPRLARGDLIPALAWQEGDGGLDCGQVATQASVTHDGFVLHGAKRFVIPGAGADGFVVSAAGMDGMALYWVEAGAKGVRVDGERRADGTWSGRVRLTDVWVSPAQRVASPVTALAALERAVDEALVLESVELVAVLECCFSLTLDYLRMRAQFGRLIGSFQALQHRAADMLIQQRLTQAVVRDALARIDVPCASAIRKTVASRAKARAAHAALRIATECIQFHGAMGMADETDVGLYLQRVLVLNAWLGGASMHVRRYASLAPHPAAEASAMDVGLRARAEAIGTGPAPDWNAMADAEFRALMRAFYDAFFPVQLRYLPRRAHWQEFAHWYRFQATRGVIAPHWPVEHGGMGLRPVKQRIFQEEQERFALVRGGLEIGITMVGPLLIQFGTDAQRARFLPAILSGEVVFCQGYSEPGAGSDLAALSTAAVRDGEHFVVNGRKLWTSMAQDATHAVLLVRTDATAKKQEGISFLLMDLASPGVQRRPFSTIAGEDEFCEVVLQDVRVPADHLVGALNKGWSMAKSLLGFERIWIGSPKRCMSIVQRLEAVAAQRGLHGDVEFALRFSRLKLDVADLGTCYEEYVAKAEAGEPIGPDVSVLKIWATETFQRLSELAIDVSGDCGGLWRDFEFADGRFDILSPFYEGRGATIGGGSSEIQRNILARAVLGLPG